jgi:hypothetical protein
MPHEDRFERVEHFLYGLMELRLRRVLGLHKTEDRFSVGIHREISKGVRSSGPTEGTG